MKKQNKDMGKLREIMLKLQKQEPLEPKHRDHQLSNELQDLRDCHIEPDWILLYKVEGDTIYFVRTGSHSDLFK